MNNAVWHKGPPPSIGWWPASRTGTRGFYRWWDGKQWSAPVSRHASAADAVVKEIAAAAEFLPPASPAEIALAAIWQELLRVPRV